MGNRQKILTELSSISPFLAEIEPTNLFSLPERYFDNLPEVILEKIWIADKKLSSLSNSNTFQVPKDYFENLSEQILSSIKQSKIDENEIKEELNAIAPLLNTIRKEAIYQVPDGYFKQSDFIASIKNEKRPAKIVPIHLAKKWIQYASAAVVAGILVTAAFLFTDTKNYQEFEKYNQVDFSSALTSVKDEDLVKYLNSPEQIQNSIPEAILSEGQDVVDVENTSIQHLTDEELAHYLSENTESGKLTTLPKNK